MSFINKFATDFTSKVVKKSVKIARDKLPESISCKDLGTKPCTKINYYKTLKNIHQKNYTKANQCCEDKKYELVKKYFNSTKNKLEDLLECLKEIYSFEKDKKKNPAFKLYLCGSSSKGDDNSKSFIEDYFPRDNSVGSSNFKRQHVFEAICKLILAFNYDNGYYGKKKEFYESLEKYSLTKKNKQDITKILNTEINAGNSAGVVDIFFSQTPDTSTDLESPWSCEQTTDPQVKSTTDREFILIQNKYYTNEFADVEKYDYSKILRKAKKLNSTEFDNFRIVLMVNNSKVLSEKINYEDESLQILENDKLEEWFNNFLIDLNKFSIEEFKNPHIKRTNNTIQPRFHQELFIETTSEYLSKEAEKKRKKFIWGAVPRSGKSYMIAGMISKRARTNFNDIILILGAKTETQKQFTELFEGKNFLDFQNYGVIYDGQKKSTKEKNIYIFSQEKFKANNKNSLTKEEKQELKQILEEKKKFKTVDSMKLKRLKELEIKKNTIEYELTDKTKAEFSKLFKTGNRVDIYFDEIHSGGSTEKSREILKSFENEEMSIDLFVMVTATFAKPNIAYEEFMGSETPIIIEWTYEDQQLMKNIHLNDVNIDIIKYNRNKNVKGNEDVIDNTEYDVINRLFTEYNYKYGDNFKQILAKQYEHHPELVLINPETLNSNIFNFTDKDLTDHFFKLKCSAINYKNSNQPNLLKYDEIFQNKNHLDELIDLIGKYNRNSDGTLSLNENCLYSILKNEFQFDIINSEIPRSQLWFLPTQNLYNDGKEYNTDEECQPQYDEGVSKKLLKTNYQSTIDEFKSPTTKEPKPHIEPLTRGVALALMNNELFEKHFNVLIIHTNGELYKLSGLNKNINVECVCFEEKKKRGGKKDSIIEKIQDFEKRSKISKKGLIILTGSILRLGVSLPCVDIALNFDNLASVDLNYQTMFRVLTESASRNKKFGYYVDFNKERTIKFVYEYNQIYSNILKKSKTIEDIGDAQQNILQLFNFNGITFGKQKIKEKLRLYSKMVEELKLDVESLRTQYKHKMNDIIGKLILKISNPSDLYKLNKLLQIKFKKQPNKIIKLVEDGPKKKKSRKTKPKTENSTTDESESESESEEPKHDDYEVSQLEIQRNMEAFLPGIVFLLAYFSEEYKCTELESCLNNAIEDIDNFDDKLCECTNKKNFYLACYFNKFKTENYTNKEFKDLLISLKGILFDSEMYVSIRNALIIFYDNIRSSFTMKQSGGASSVSEKPKYLPLIFKIYQKDRSVNKDNFNKWIEETIYNFLPIREEAKDKHGEVFTPRELIDEMMNKLNEIDSSVFRNKTLKWLDPANGVGNFPLIVYGMLMKSLKSSIPNDYERSQHILTDMLYMVELQEDNYQISRKLFGKEANIFCDSFLAPDNKSINPDIAKKFKVEKYDIIMGNPPFQKAVDGIRKGGYGGRTLWDKFIELSFAIMNKNGYLGFINPSNWRGTGGNSESSRALIFSKQLKFLHVYGESDGKKYFNAGTRFDLYIVKNIDYKNNINIIDELGESYSIDLKEFPFIPNYEFKNIKKILTTQENGMKIIYSRSDYGTDKKNLKDKKIGSYIYPVVHTITQDKITYWYTNDTSKGHFGVPKVLLNFNRHQYNHSEQNDYEGKYGMSQITFGIPISSKKEGELILNAVNTPEFKEIIKATKWGAFVTEWRMFTYFKKDFWKEFVNEDGSVKGESSATTENTTKPKPKKTAKVSVNSSTNKPASKKKTVVYKETENQTLGSPFKHSDGSKEEFGDEEEKKRLCTESDKCSGLTSNKTKKKPVKFKMRQGKSVKPTPGAFTFKKMVVGEK